MPDTNNQQSMPTTPQDMLAKVNEAILAITVGGQQYKIGSRMLVRADLKELYKIKNDLEAQVQAQTTASTGLFDDCYVAVFNGR